MRMILRRERSFFKLMLKSQLEMADLNFYQQMRIDFDGSKIKGGMAMRLVRPKVSKHH